MTKSNYRFRKLDEFEENYYRNALDKKEAYDTINGHFQGDTSIIPYYLIGKKSKVLTDRTYISERCHTNKDGQERVYLDWDSSDHTNIFGGNTE